MMNVLYDNVSLVTIMLLVFDITRRYIDLETSLMLDILQSSDTIELFKSTEYIGCNILWWIV